MLVFQSRDHPCSLRTKMCPKFVHDVTCTPRPRAEQYNNLSSCNFGQLFAFRLYRSRPHLERQQVSLSDVRGIGRERAASWVREESPCEEMHRCQCSAWLLGETALLRAARCFCETGKASNNNFVSGSHLHIVTHGLSDYQTHLPKPEIFMGRNLEYDQHLCTQRQRPSLWHFK